jgi:structural maintenance of chromosome 3 (chondroitin sulfate proteoglycan 6)
LFFVELPGSRCLKLVLLNNVICSNKQDAFPLIQKLQYTQKFDKAMQYVFGKTLLCRNMQVAFNFVDENNLDCITLDGDQVSTILSPSSVY